MGCGFIPEPLAREHIAAGRLVAKAVQRPAPEARMGYAWRATPANGPRRTGLGEALKWWLKQLESPATRTALIERHCGLLQQGLD